jgi:hypothetical protein
VAFVHLRVLDFFFGLAAFFAIGLVLAIGAMGLSLARFFI